MCRAVAGRLTGVGPTGVVPPVWAQLVWTNTHCVPRVSGQIQFERGSVTPDFSNMPVHLPEQRRLEHARPS